MLVETVNANIKRIRVAQGFTQHELAKKTGLHVQYISRLESQPQNFTLNLLEKLAKGLGVEPEDLVRSGSGRRRKTLQSFDEALKLLKKFRAGF